MTSLTQSIAGFAAGFSRQDIPAASITLAREAFIDLLGVMLAGAGEPVVPILKAVTAGDTAGPPCSLLLDAGQRRSATAAALVNGTAAHALDFDDVQFNAHPSTVLVPAILAEAERSGASGLKALQAGGAASDLALPGPQHREILGYPAYDEAAKPYRLD